MPSVSRAITDIARLSPHFTPVGNGDGSGPDVLSVGGRSSRYNNIQIDGANNNDLFALAGNSGNPGGGHGHPAVSFDAIQEVQLVVAPYDVRQGGFTGGGINAITRSGTNKYHGTVSTTSRNQSLVGDSASATGPSAPSARSSTAQPGRAHREEQGLLLRERGPRPQQDAFRMVGGRLVGPDVRPRGGGGALPEHPAEPVRLRSRAARREFIKDTPNDKVLAGSTST